MVIVCDPDKIKKHGIVGAPDFALEILSPSSAKIDHMVKRWAYSKARVKEYWIVDPANQLVEGLSIKRRRFRIRKCLYKRGLSPCSRPGKFIY